METPKIAVVLPYGNNYSPDGATSIDLCAREFTLNSRYRASTKIFAEEAANPFGQDIAVEFRKRRDLNTLIAQIHAFQPNLIVVHQNLPYAYKLAKASGKPVLLHRHNYYDKKGWLSRFHRKLQLRKLAGVIFVSESVRQEFLMHWGTPSCDTHVVHNGIDASSWSAAQERKKEIVFAGRSNWVKGLVPLSKCLLQLLPNHPEWNACLMVSRIAFDPKSFAEAKEILKPVMGQVELIEEAPFSVVKERLQQAEISVMPTLGMEPFGRSAIEAMAGGAALAASRLGGLAEVSGQGEEMAIEEINPIDEFGIYRALDTLILDPSLRQTLAQRGHQRVLQHFTLQKVCRDLDGIYEKSM